MPGTMLIVPFTPGSTDATSKSRRTVEHFRRTCLAALASDGFRNCTSRPDYTCRQRKLLIRDKAQLLT